MARRARRAERSKLHALKNRRRRGRFGLGVRGAAGRGGAGEGVLGTWRETSAPRCPSALASARPDDVRLTLLLYGGPARPQRRRARFLFAERKPQVVSLY